MAAAASTDAPPDDPGDTDAGMRAELLPQEGHIHIDDDVSGRSVVTCSRSLRRQFAPAEGGPYTLEFDESGYGALVGSSDLHVTLLESWMTRKTYQNANGENTSRSSSRMVPSFGGAC